MTTGQELIGSPAMHLGFRTAFWVMLAVATHQTLSPVPIEVLQERSDIGLHLLCWSSLSLALYVAFRSTGRYWLLLVLLFLYSIGLEFAQRMVPGRFFDTRDMLVNAAACTAAYCMIRLWERLSSE